MYRYICYDAWYILTLDQRIFAKPSQEATIKRERSIESQEILRSLTQLV